MKSKLSEMLRQTEIDQKFSRAGSMLLDAYSDVYGQYKDGNIELEEMQEFVAAYVRATEAQIAMITILNKILVKAQGNIDG